MTEFGRYLKQCPAALKDKTRTLSLLKDALKNDLPKFRVLQAAYELGILEAIQRGNPISTDDRLKITTGLVSQYAMLENAAKNAYRVSASECLVIEFEMYSIIEFTTKTMGPLYIYRKDIFEKFVKKYLKRMNNTELRHSLYNELLQYATERIIHHDNWQYKTSRYLMAHSII